MSMPDGLLVRVKPHAGVIPAEAAWALAAAAADAGCASMLLTSRANLQLRGLTAAGAARFAEAMVACGLAVADPGHERRRNLIVSPLAGIDPACDPATWPIADAIAAALAEARFAGLPDKFGFAVDGGGMLPLGDVRGDVRVAAAAGTWLVWADGAEDATVCGAEEAAGTALCLAASMRARPLPRPWSAPPPEPARGGSLAAAPLPLPLRELAGGRRRFARTTRLTLIAPEKGHLPVATLPRCGEIRLTPWRLLLTEPCP